MYYKQEDISQLFKEYGQINRITLLRPRGGNRTLRCYLAFESEDSIESALSKNGTVVSGQTLFVRLIPCLRSFFTVLIPASLLLG